MKETSGEKRVDDQDENITRRELRLELDAGLSKLERRLYVIIAAAFVGLKFNIPSEASVAAVGAVTLKAVWSGLAGRFGL